MLSQVYQDALDQYTKRPVPWILVNGIVALAGTVIPVLGALALLPALLRETTAAIDEDRDPKLEALFDTSTLAEDLTSMALYTGAQLVGLLMCLVGWPVAWIMFWMTPEIRSMRLTSPVDGMKLSAAYVSANLGSIIGVVIIDAILLSVGLSIAYFGVYLVMPLIMLSWSSYLRHARPELEAMAAERQMLLPDHQASAI